MKVNIVNIFIAILSFHFTGCNVSDQSRDNVPERLSGNHESIFIDIKKASKISLFDIFDHLELIPLETTESSVIQEVSKILNYNEKFYVLDDKQSAVLIFDKDGKYIRKIQKIGKGPGEYSMLYDININQFSEHLELLNPRGELLLYDLSCGDFVNSIRLPLRAPHNFAILSSDTIIFYSPYEPKKLSYFSRSQNKVIKEEFEFPDIIHKTPLNSYVSPFFQHGSSTVFYQGFSNSIYEIENCNARLKFQWDFGDYNFDVKDLIPDQDFNFYGNYLRNCNDAHSFIYYIENDKVILTRFMFNKLWQTMIFFKCDSNCLNITRFKEQIVPPAISHYFNNGILTTVEPAQIQLLVNESVLSGTDLKIYNNIKLEDNPVIIKYYFKNQ